MEGSFAQAANLHHFKKARWRRLWRQQIQDWLIAACQNIKLLACQTRGDRLAGFQLGTQFRLALGTASTLMQRCAASFRVPSLGLPKLALD